MDADRFDQACSVKKNGMQIRGEAILTDKPWSIKELLSGFLGNFSSGMERVVPSRQNGIMLPVQIANHSIGFGLTCPLTELVNSWGN